MYVHAPLLDSCPNNDSGHALHKVGDDDGAWQLRDRALCAETFFSSVQIYISDATCCAIPKRNRRSDWKETDDSWVTKVKLSVSIPSSINTEYLSRREKWSCMRKAVSEGAFIRSKRFWNTILQGQHRSEQLRSCGRILRSNRIYDIWNAFNLRSN